MVLLLDKIDFEIKSIFWDKELLNKEKRDIV